MNNDALTTSVVTIGSPADKLLIRPVSAYLLCCVESPAFSTGEIMLRAT